MHRHCRNCLECPLDAGSSAVPVRSKCLKCGYYKTKKPKPIPVPFPDPEGPEIAAPEGAR